MASPLPTPAPRSAARPLIGLALAGAGFATWAWWARRDTELEQRTRKRLA